MTRRDFLNGLAGLAIAMATPKSFGSDVVESRVIPSIPVFAHYCTWHHGGFKRDQVATMPIRRQEEYVYGYDSLNTSIIRQHNEEMLANGVMPMLSWWAKDTFAGDNFLDAYFPVGGAQPKAGILYEATDPMRFNTRANRDIDFDDPHNADTFVSDMAHLQDKYFGNYPDRFFRIDGRPVVFIWISHAFTGNFADVTARAREKSDFYLVGSNYSVPLHSPRDVSPGLENIVGGMDAISSYGIYNWRFYGEHMKRATGQPKDFFADYANAVGNWSDWLGEKSPRTNILLPLAFSYDDRHIPERRADGEDAFWSDDATARDFAELVRGIIANPCGSGRVLPLAYITSYNEHYEGTGIEPSIEYGSSYLDIIRQTFMPPVEITREQVRDFCAPENERRK